MLFSAGIRRLQPRTGTKFRSEKEVGHGQGAIVSALPFLRWAQWEQ